MPFRSLTIARSAMLAHNEAIDVTARNVANVETPGYHRQRPITVADAHGFGVRTITVERVRDQFIEGQIQRQVRLQGAETSLRDGLLAVEAVTNDLTGQGLAYHIGQFFDSFATLASRPESMAARWAVIGAAQSMAETFQRTASDLDYVRRDMDGQIRVAVDRGNTLIAEIAELNRLVPNAPPETPNNELADQRDAALQELIELTGATVHDNGDNTVDVLIGGVRVIHRATGLPLETAPKADEPRFCVVQLQGGQELPQIGGKIAGYMQVRDTYVPSYLSDLDDVANAIIDSVNALHVTGVGLDGSTGLNLFLPGTGAAGMDVEAAVAADPSKIGASTSGAPGDGALALSISELRYDTTLVGGRHSVEEAYSQIVSQVGADVQRAEDRAEVRQTLRANLEAQRDIVSGVSLDEEAVNLMRYQAGFQAAAKVAATVNEMLDDLFALLS